MAIHISSGYNLDILIQFIAAPDDRFHYGTFIPVMKGNRSRVDNREK
ncbi:MAG: hypothetical protein M1472_00735 [Planctomycetes bacterium]|nr:hypothetical protein [Planctomycetota bacterium]